MSQTKPAHLTRTDVVVLLAVLEQVTGGESVLEMTEHVYPQLVRLESEFLQEMGELQ